MKEAILQVLMCALGTLGFALCFHVNSKHLLAAMLGSALSQICYLLVYGRSESLFLSAMLSSMLVCLWSETMARIRKAPANIFLIPGIVPLLPGSKLYYAMNGIVRSEMDVFIQNGSATALVAFGIASGIVAASEIVNVVLEVTSGRKQKTPQK